MNKRALYPLFFIIALGLDLLCLRALAENGVWVGYEVSEAIFWHFLALLIVAGTSRFWYPESIIQNRFLFWMFIVGFALFLPVVGIAFLFGFRLIFYLKPASHPERKYYYGGRQILAPPRYNEFPSDTKQSVLEIMREPDAEARRRAILAMRSVDPKKALPVLQKAIQDSDEQVRLMAQAQYNKLIENLENTIKSLESELKKTPEKQALMVQLAEHYNELVYLGLCGEESEEYYLNQTISLLRRALELDPHNLSIRMMLLKSCLKNSQLTQARECLDVLKAHKYNPEILAPWEAELCFLERDWIGLHKILDVMHDRWNRDPRMRSLVEIWSKSNSEAV